MVWVCCYCLCRYNQMWSYSLINTPLTIWKFRWHFGRANHFLKTRLKNRGVNSGQRQQDYFRSDYFDFIMTHAPNKILFSIREDSRLFSVTVQFLHKRGRSWRRRLHPASSPRLSPYMQRMDTCQCCLRTQTALYHACTEQELLPLESGKSALQEVAKQTLQTKHQSSESH